MRTIFARTEGGGLAGVVPRGLALGFSREPDEAPFDLKKGPLLRVSLVESAPDEHEIVLRVHHSILDGWSTGIVWRRLEENYLALGKGAPLPRVTAAFRDFLRWHQAGEVAQELEDWRRLLAGCPAGAAVPTGLPRLGAPAIRTRSTTWELGSERSERLVAAARTLGTTESALFQALWGVFLGKLTRATDVVFGATLSGRSERVPQVEEIVGLLINTVPVRVTWEAGTTFRELTEQVRTQAAGGLERTRVALADLQQAVLEHGTLVQHTLVFENYPAEEASATQRPWQVETVAIDDPMHFEFGLVVVPRREGWFCRVIADEARYPESYLRALKAAWEEAVDACLNQPEARIDGWSLARDPRRSRPIAVAATFTAEPVEEALGFWQDALGYAGDVRFAPFNQVQQQLVDPRSELATNRAGLNVLLVRLEDWAGERRDDAQAVESSLELAGDLLVDGLRRLGESATSTLQWVVFCPASVAAEAMPDLKRRIEAVEARLVRRIESIGSRHVQVCRSAEIGNRAPGVELRDGRAEALGGVPYTEAFFQSVATEAMRRADALARPPLKVLALDADNTLWRGILGEDGAAGLVVTAAHRALQLAAKTLKDKGWVLALVTKNNAEDIAALWRERPEFPLGESDFVAVEAGWGAKSESLRALALRLNLGLDGILFLDDSALECAEVRAALPEVLALQVPAEEAELARFVENCWALDATAATEEDRRRSELYRTEAQREQTRQTSGGLRAFVAQLQLEVRLLPIDAGNLARAAQLTQRTNQFNASTRRRTETELQALLASGWQGHVVEVKDRFGAYGLTGCVVWRIAEGILEVDTLLLSCRVLGRGVEHALMRWLAAEAVKGDVERVRVTFEQTRKNAPAEQFFRGCAERFDDGAFEYRAARLAILEIADSDRSAPTEDTERAPDVRATRGLPAAWAFHQTVATELATVEGLARAVAGYRSRQRQRSTAAEYEVPRDPREERIAAIWAEVLGVERVGRRDSFFALGGHSLRAVMMLARVNRALGVDLPLDAVFAAPLLADFVARVAIAAPAGDGDGTIEAAQTAEHYPVSHAQRRLWMVEQMRAEGPSPFHMSAAFAVTGALDENRLTAAVHALVARHESLRTGIVAVDSEPRQVVRAEVMFEIETVREVGAFVARDFDLSQPPLLRLGLQREQGKVSRLIFVMHHIVSDGWSIAVIAQELSRLYRTGVTELPPLAVQYKDFAAWQAARLASGRMSASLAYWTTLFAERPAPLELPTDRPRPATKQSQGAEWVSTLSQADWTACQRAAEREGLSPFMAAMAVLQLVLARQGRAERFVVGTPVAGRDRPEFEEQIGFYVNLLPILAEVRSSETIGAHLARVKKTVVSALSHAAYPFDRLVDELKLPRDLARTPLFDVLLVYQNNREADLDFEGVGLSLEERPATTSQYDLTFEFAETAEGLRLRVEYDVALFDASRGERLGRQVLEGLRRAWMDTSARVSSVELCPADERARLAEFERGAEFGRYRETTIPALVWAAGAATPDKTALVAGGRTLSFRELEARARALARRVTAAGVTRQSAVAVAGERTEDFIVAMLGAMQAGCVYLPLELKHPDARLRAIVEDAHVRHGLALGAEAATRLRGLGLTLVGDLAGEVAAPLEPAASDIAYTIYTSGSTGRPKGVEIAHGPFATMIEAQIAAFGVEPADRCAWWASSAFDASLSEIFLGLACGATVVVAGEAEREDPDRFLAWLRSERVTVATLPPAFLRVLNRTPLDPLRVLITAGEAANPADARHYANRLNYFNAYGPTETSVCATVQRVEPGVDYGANVPIGRPLAVASTYVLDAAGRRAPLG
ncbi:MAG TPA: HAD-IIIC family phosphatase, partial [Opitutaceae bacterium]